MEATLSRHIVTNLSFKAPGNLAWNKDKCIYDVKVVRRLKHPQQYQWKYRLWTIKKTTSKTAHFVVETNFSRLLGGAWRITFWVTPPWLSIIHDKGDNSGAGDGRRGAALLVWAVWLGFGPRSRGEQRIWKFCCCSPHFFCMEEFACVVTQQRCDDHLYADTYSTQDGTRDWLEELFM